MKALVVFEQANAHPLAWILDKRIRHVWCVIEDPERGWARYDWDQGMPRISTYGWLPVDDMVAWLREFPSVQEVLVVERSQTPVVVPLLLNNCVSQTKLICGVRHWAVTPFQLFTHLSRKIDQRSIAARSNAQAFWSLFRAPGFGGGGDDAPQQALPPPPAPEPQFVPPTKDKEESVEEHRMRVQKAEKEFNDNKKKGLLVSGPAGNSGPGPGSGGPAGQGVSGGGGVSI